MSAQQQLLAADAALAERLMAAPPTSGVADHLPLGRLLPVVAGAFTGAGKGDWAAVGPRERVGAVLRGCSVDRLVDPMAGAQPYKLSPVSASPGARLLQAVGLGLASGGPVLCMIGMAGAASGELHEALSVSVQNNVKLVILVTDLRVPAEAGVARQTGADLLALAAAHGARAAAVAPTEPAVREAVAAARLADGPSLLLVAVP